MVSTAVLIVNRWSLGLLLVLLLPQEDQFAQPEDTYFIFLLAFVGEGYTTRQSIVAPWWGYLSSYNETVREVAP